MSISSGTIVTYTASSSTGFTTSPNDEVTRIAGLLDAQGWNVLSQSIQTQGIFDEVIGGIAGLSIPYTVTMQVKISGDYGAIDDVKSIIDHQFYAAYSKLPASSSITSYTSPKIVLPAATGEPQQSDLGGAQQSPVTSSAFSFLSAFGKDAGYLALGLLGIAIVVFAVINYGPSSVAKAMHA